MREITNASHLQAKKLYPSDKRRAERLMSDSLQELAAENGLQLTEQRAMQFVADQRTRRVSAYIAYGHWLILRLEGQVDGPAILALWRIIAWDPRGGMRPGFTLQLNDFIVAETELLAAMQDAN